MIVDTREYDPAKLGRKITPEEAKRIQVDMLDALVAFCDAVSSFVGVSLAAVVPAVVWPSWGAVVLLIYSSAAAAIGVLLPPQV